MEGIPQAKQGDNCAELMENDKASEMRHWGIHQPFSVLLEPLGQPGHDGIGPGTVLAALVLLLHRLDLNWTLW